jgi:hypothetical protein
MADGTQSLLNLVPTVVAGGVVIGLTRMMFDDKKHRKSKSRNIFGDYKRTKKSKSMSILDTVW